ncbi:MAG: putative chromosome-partitioning protein ParB [Pelotomaculum sp. PtaU1.Bin065]|nr:MAG: putative chromosome-partitioning protein ParB [Pelotomaculum sp. PtaU1.Bin065]
MSRRGTAPRLITKILPIERVRPNNWNPNEVDKKTMAKLKADIKRKGFVPPIIVRKVGPDEWEIVDGEHRWEVCKELGHTTIPAVETDMDEQEAKLKTVQLNYLRGSPVPVRMAALVHDLNKHMTLDDIEAALPYDRLELEDNLALLKLPQDIDRQVEEKAERERKAEPIFISATIHKDKVRGLHEFVEQAMLASEATFCEIKIKIECPAGDHDLTLDAMRNLAKIDCSRAEELKDEKAPVIVRFALFPEQAYVLDQALQYIIYTQQYVKNPRGMALEMLAADFLSGINVGAENREPEWSDEPETTR